jgi:hypothetical protein
MRHGRLHGSCSEKVGNVRAKLIIAQ